MPSLGESPPTERVSFATPKASRKLTGPERHEIKIKYLAGATTYDLASEYGIHRETVGRALRAQGVSPRAKVRRLTDQQVQQAAALYQQGCTLAQLAEDFEVGKETIRRELKNAGISFRPRGGSN